MPAIAGSSDPGPLIEVSDGDYVAGKWGRYLRAPDFYFEVMQRFGQRFVALGEIVDVRYGVKTGCDAFFMPLDVTEHVLSGLSPARTWST
ncbi:MAG: hypothetical protein JSU63_11470 [Phycisphaerales bacterium]|nr:MAG: hypothetical protein JSU63_11470 [Phycisphaerales bacterium]